MKVFGGLFGGSGGQGPRTSLFTRSSDGFASMAAFCATIFVVPVAWAGIEGWAARELVRLYGPDVSILMFWALQLGAYPLVFFAIRMSLATTFATLAIGVALRFL